jgi:hypothetical protein
MRGRPFQKGADARRKPGGLPEGYGAFREACQSYSGRALKVLADSLESEDERIALEAAKVLLERAWGKAAAAPEDLDAVKQGNPLAGLTPEQVLKLAKGETL